MQLRCKAQQLEKTVRKKYVGTVGFRDLLFYHKFKVALYVPTDGPHIKMNKIYRTVFKFLISPQMSTMHNGALLTTFSVTIATNFDITGISSCLLIYDVKL